MNTENGIEDMDPIGVQNDGEPAVVETAEPEPEAVEPETAEPEATEEAEEAPKKKPGSVRAREKAARLEAENETLRKLLVEQNQQKPAPVEVIEPGKPRQEDFETFSEFQEALTDWKVDKKLAALEEAKRNQQVQETIAKKLESGRNKYEDFDDDLAEILPLAANNPVGQAITESENTEDLIHYFAENQNELKRIRNLSPTRIGAEIARLEASFAPAKPKPTTKTSTAPKPLTPVTPRAAVISNDRFKGIESF